MQQDSANVLRIEVRPAGESAGSIGIGASVLYVALVGNLIIALGAAYWGGYSQYLHFSDALIAKIMSAENLGSTLGSVAGIFYMHRATTNLRKVTYMALTAYVVGNWLTPDLVRDPLALLICRFFCGISSGTTFLAAVTAVAGLKSAPRLITLVYGTPYMAGFILQPLLPHIFSTWGFASSFRLVAAAAAATLLFYPVFPTRVAYDAGGSSGSEALSPNRSRLALTVVALSLLLQYVANSGVWLFFERIGVLAGHSEQTAADLVGLGTGMALVGTALATASATRLPPLAAMLVGACLMVISTFMLHFSASLAIYAVSITAFNVLITFVTAFYFILFTRVFRSTQAVIVGNMCMMVGYTFGPLLIGYTVRGGNFTGTIDATIALFVVSIALLVFYAVSFRRKLQ